MKFNTETFAESKVPRSSAAEPVDRGLPKQASLLPCLVFLWVLFSQCSYAGQLSLDEILKKVSETYQNLESYHFVAEQKTELAAAGSIESAGGTAYSNFHKSMDSEIGLAAVKPGKVRLMVKDERREVLLVSDGETTWTYMPRQKQYTEELGLPPDAAHGPQAAGNAGTPILSEYQNFLVNRFRGLAQYGPTATLEKDGRIKVGNDKIECYVVKIQTPQVRHKIWVDKQRFLVLRFEETPERPREGISYQSAISVNMKEASVNTKLQDSLFKFTPPEKATKVQSLSRPGRNK